MEEQEEYYIGYKIDTKHSYKVYVNESNGKKFYKVQIKKKNVDDTEISFYKQLRFAKCNPPENGEIIKIHKGFEDLYVNNIDKYNPISVIVVMEYEKVDNDVVNQEKAYEKYKKAVSEDENDKSVPQVNDEDLPF